MMMLALLVSACGKKDAPNSVAEAVTETVPVEAAAPEPAPEPEPPPPPPGPVANVDLTVTLTFADGSSHSGNVIRIERANDLYGEEGWSGEAANIKINAESDTAYQKITWDTVSSITIRPGAIPRDVSCTYSSSYMPWMYECAISNTPTMTDTDGNTWKADTGQKWRFIFADETEYEFWLKKHYVRIQDDTEPSLDTEMVERPELYTALNQQLAEAVRGPMVVSIRVE